MGFIISVCDNLTDLSDNQKRKSFHEFYSARDLMVDQNTEIFNKKNASRLYPILELCANSINATFSINKDQNWKDSTIGQLIIVDIRMHDIFLTFYDYETDATDRIDLIHIENPKLKCVIEKGHEEAIDISFDVHNVMGIVDVNKLDTIKKIVHICKNASFNKDQKEKEKKKG